MLRAFVLAALLGQALPCAADPIVLRMAAIAPDGTAWARDARAFAREVESATSGQIKVKWYLGGIAGDETAVIERIRRGQLDGSAGATFCQRLAPSLRVVRVPGVLSSRAEHQYVLARLRPRLIEEFRRSGFELVSLSPFGTDIVFSKTPVRSFAELKQLKVWVWDLDTVMRELAQRIGLQVVAAPLEEARRGLDSGKIDAMVALPSAALAYQWSTRMKYFLDLRVAVLPGCLVIASRTFDRLPRVLQDDLREAGARMGVRFDDSGRALDDALLGGLFEKQGLIKLPVTDGLRSAFFQAARAARDELAEDLVPRELLDQVLGWLADYRGEHAR